MVVAEAVRFSFRERGATRNPVKATFHKDVSEAQDADRRSHSAAESHDRNSAVTSKKAASSRVSCRHLPVWSLILVATQYFFFLIIITVNSICCEER